MTTCGGCGATLRPGTPGFCCMVKTLDHLRAADAKTISDLRGHVGSLQERLRLCEARVTELEAECTRRAMETAAERERATGHAHTANEQRAQLGELEAELNPLKYGTDSRDEWKRRALEHAARADEAVRQRKTREPTRDEMERALGAADETFLDGTVRRCIDCRAPVFGGPTRCSHCAGAFSARAEARLGELQSIYYLADKVTDLVAEFPNDPAAWSEWMDALSSACLRLPRDLNKAPRETRSGWLQNQATPAQIAFYEDAFAKGRLKPSDFAELMTYVDAAKEEAQKIGRYSGQPLAEFLRELREHGKGFEPL
jgi:hypothetical protein